MATVVKGLTSTRMCETKAYVRSNKHGGSADQLKLAPLNSHHRQETIDEVNGKEERLTVKVVLLRDFHQPINEDRPHVGRNIGLTLHVVRPRTIV